MQLTFDLDSTFDYPPIAVPLYWLSNWNWGCLFWESDNERSRRIERDGRIVRRFFPDGISQYDFMKTIYTDQNGDRIRVHRHGGLAEFLREGEDETVF